MDTLLAARQQMALSLGWHIVIACFGVAFPFIVVFTEWRAYKNDDPVRLTLARRWSRVLGVLFAVGAVSGTILSFEFGILWPKFMSRFGDVFGVPFAMEGFAFFIEGIFIGIYLYGWDRLPRRAHLLAGLPIIASGILATVFVVSANAWMNHPRGFDIDASGEVVNVDPWAAVLHAGTAVESAHMLLAAFMVAGFVAAVPYAWAWLKGRRSKYYRLGFAIPFTVAAIATPLQLVMGDTAARWVANEQPIKLAAMEGLYETTADAPESIGGIFVDDELKGAVEIPCGLSFLIAFDCDYEVQGLESVAPDDRPPVNIVHWAFDTMVGIGTALAALVMWFAFVWWRRRHRDVRLPQSKWFYRAALLAGPAAIVALEAGWIVTEVGRQPWIVYGVMRTEDAVTDAGGIVYTYAAVWVIYLALTAALLFVLRLVARTPIPDDVEAIP